MLVIYNNVRVYIYNYLIINSRFSGFSKVNVKRVNLGCFREGKQGISTHKKGPSFETIALIHY